MDLVKRLKSQVWPANSHILLFSVAKDLLRMAEKCALLRRDSVDFSFYVWNKLSSINVLGNQTWCHSNDHNSTSNSARKSNFFLKKKNTINPGTLD